MSANDQKVEIKEPLPMPPLPDEKILLFRSIGIQVVVAVVLGLVFEILGRFSPMYLFVPFFMGAMVWTVVLFFKPLNLFNKFFVLVPPNNGAVYAKTLTSLEAPPDYNQSGSLDIKNTQTLLEFGPGWQGIMPWWQLVGNVFIDLNRSIPITKTVKCYDSEGIPVEVEYNVFLTALRGYLHNLIRHGENGPTMIEKYCDGFIITVVKGMSVTQLLQGAYQNPDKKDVTKQFGELSNKFEGLFGGPGKISWLETVTGWFTGSPAISSVAISKEYESLFAVDKKASAMKEAVKKILEDSDIDPDLAASMANEMVGGQSKVEFIRIKGLENLRYGAFPGFPAGGKKENKKGEK